VLNEGVPHASHPGCWHTALGLSAGMWWIPSPSKDLERARHRAQDAGALELMSATDAKLLNRAQERLVRLWRCAMKPSDLARVVIDTTVQPKAVMFPG